MTLHLLGQNPSEKWEQYTDPVCVGWDTTEIGKFYRISEASALLVIEDGKIVIRYGDVSRRFKCHSVRKSLLSCIYGAYVKDGTIDIEMKLGDISIPDFKQLAETEQTTSIKNLLTSKSGIYVSAGLETQQMKDGRPARGSHQPGTYWYYNNWDFNALGTILNEITRKDLFESFNDRIAKPLQMEDFRIFDGTYDYEDTLVNHPGYPFKMSARDLARFGQLYLQNGMWNNQQILSQEWIIKSTQRYHKFKPGDINYISNGYGFLFWIIEGESAGTKSYYADGYGGQFVGVYPAKKLVIVIRGNTYDNKTAHHRRSLVNAILNAKTLESVEGCDTKVLNINDDLDSLSFKLTINEMQRFVGNYEIDDNKFSIEIFENDLILKDYHYYYKFKLIPLRQNEFLIEDLEKKLTFRTNEMNEIKPIIE